MIDTVKLSGLADAVLTGQRMTPQYLDLGYSRPLPFRAESCVGSETLVVLLHGAVDRRSRTYPSFAPYIQGIRKHAHQIAFADPTLALSDDVSIAWFVGSHDFPVQKTLVAVLTRLIQDLNIRKIIFVGGSGGGFAALYFAWHFENSLAIAFSPQTIIANYGEMHQKRYKDAAWPEGLAGTEQKSVLDLRDLYTKRFSNNLIYLQSHGDVFHLHNHCIPFLEAIPSELADQILIKISYWNKNGHPGAVPLSEVDAWVRAALAAGSNKIEEIRSEFYNLFPEPVLANVSDLLQAGNDMLQAGNDISRHEKDQHKSAQHQLAERLAREVLERQ